MLQRPMINGKSDRSEVSGDAPTSDVQNQMEPAVRLQIALRNLSFSLERLREYGSQERLQVFPESAAGENTAKTRVVGLF